MKIHKVALRMLIDYIKVLDEEKHDFEIGCRCKDAEIAVKLHSFLMLTLSHFPCIVDIKEETIVFITESHSIQELRFHN